LSRSCSRWWKAAALGAIAVALVGCGSVKSKRSTTAIPVGPRDRWGTVWLCRPGLSADPCTSGLATTIVSRRGATRVEQARPASAAAIDCFYVYPTVSGQATVNANLAIGLRERLVAVAQASRFSQVCRVYAPVYRQITLNALRHPGRITRAEALIAYDSVRSAFQDYLAHYNDGRGVAFIGHSQGATILIHLLRREVDTNPALRRRLVSALLLGGNLTVARGRPVGGDFAHIPVCGSSRQTGCAIAYSSFTNRPPPNSQFGRITSDGGVRLLRPAERSKHLRIVCVNPASPAGGTAFLDPYLPSLALAFLSHGHAAKVHTPWVSFPGEYRAHCESSGDATWLQVTPVHGPSEHQPSLTEMRDAALGLHVLDMNIALGNLVRLLRQQARAYQSR
jgi:hypothetical protein